jgi:Tol biopolymer transport system component
MRRFVIAAVVVVSAVGLPAVRQVRAAHAVDVPSVSVGDVTTFEGDQGPAPIRVPVDLSAPSAATVKVPYSLQLAPDGSADFSDATMRSGTLTFRAGVVSKYVTVMTMGDTIVEPDQHFLVTLGTPIGGTATVEKGTGLVTIKDDDANGIFAGTEVSVGDVAIEEGDQGIRIAYLPVTLSRPAAIATKVTFAMSCATRQLLSDATVGFTGTVRFPLGARTAYIQFKVTPDTTPDAMNALREIIKAATVKVYQDEGDVTIIDDDGSLPSSTGFGVPGFTTEPLPSTSGFDQGAVGDKELVSVGYDGSPAAYDPANPDPGDKFAQTSISADGRFVAFQSGATNLVPDDTNGIEDVFIRDRLLGTTERIVKNDGSQILGSDLLVPSMGVAFRGLQISADGNTVVFRTAASLDPADVYNPQGSWLTLNSIYAYDRPTHTLKLVSVDNSGNSLPGVTAPSVSADGRYVLFGVAPDVATGVNSQGQVLGYWVRDTLLGTTTRVLPDDDVQYTYAPAISANGRYAALETERANCTDSELDVLDLMNGNTERADVTDDGQGGIGWSGLAGFAPNLSADGRYVAFQSSQWNLAGFSSDPGAPVINGTQDYSYVRDRELHSTTAVRPFGQGETPEAQISDNGQYAAYALGSQSNVVDMTTMTATPFGDAQHAPDPWYWTARPMTGDGRYVAYSVTPDPSTPSQQNVYVERLH